MGIRLLQKSEIDKLKGQEQKREIDEGAKLAKRVDTLRELAAAEETSLETFRRDTVAKINEEITHKLQERDTIDGQIRVRKGELAVLQRPLDEKWEKLTKISSELDQDRESLDAKKHLVEDREREAEEAVKSARATLSRATTKEELADSRLRDADSDALSAKSALEVADRIKRQTLESSQKLTRELTHRDMLASARERDVTIKEIAQAAEKDRLAAEWKLLEDRQAMFERNLKRI